MSSNTRRQGPLPPPHEVLIPMSDQVDIDGVSLELLQFALKLAYVHFLMFDRPLSVTAGRMISRCPGVSHENGRGLDVRTNDLSPQECEVFLAVTDWLAMQHNVIRGSAPVEDEFASMHLERKAE